MEVVATRRGTGVEESGGVGAGVEKFVSGVGPRRRPGRPGFQGRRAELLSSTHGAPTAAVEVRGAFFWGIREF